jgi:hypothetical protein
VLIHLAWAVPLVLLIFLLASPRFRGDIAERRVGRILAAGLERDRFTIVSDLLLPFGGGTIRIGHAVVSKSGIFVIESRYTPGWVSGTEVQERWTRRRFGRIHRFANPVHHNRLQTEAVARALSFPLTVFHPVVVLVGMQGFGKPRPAQVVEPERLVQWVRRAGGEARLDDDQCARALHGIDAARLPTGPAGFFRRVAWLRGLLALVLVFGLYFAFGDTARHAFETYRAAGERAVHPEAFHDDGRAKSDHELWEDSLNCAWSQDTGRCACYDPQGGRVELSPEKCRELAERGSVLKR